MIQKIGLLNFNTQHYSINKTKKNTTNPILQNQQSNNTQMLKGIPYSYIAFKGVEPSPSLKFDEEATGIVERAKTIAKINNHLEITPYHILQASIEDHEEKLNSLIENPENVTSEVISSMHNLANTFLKKDVFKDEQSLVYFIEETEKLKQENEKKMATLPKNKDNTNNELSFSEDFLQE